MEEHVIILYVTGVHIAAGHVRRPSLVNLL
jgi:hypothetical protein